MNYELLTYQIGLTLIKGIGPNLAKNLVAYLGSVEAVFKEKKANLEKIPGIGQILANEILSQNVLERAKEEVEFVVKNKITPHFYTDKSYPYRLKECNDSPIIIYQKGDLDLNNGRFISVVGTRKATEQGKEICRNIISELAQKIPHVIIVSGLAYGIDICAHKTANELNIPTIGVLGHGLDRIYPAIHRNTAVKMLSKGSLITEFMNKTNPDRQNFVQRNRIIAGLSDALLVVESAKKGGALITAHLANDYNRDVFAVPGGIYDEWSAGCNLLIKQNKAALVESADDIINFMNWEIVEQTSKEIQVDLFTELSDAEQTIFSFLRQHPDGINVNEIAVEMKTPFSKLSSQLLEMEFKGVVKCLPGGVYRVVR